MHYLLLFTSVFMETLKNIYYTHFSKTSLKTTKDAFMFNIVSCIGSVLFFFAIGASYKASVYTIVMAFIFSLVTTGAQYFSLLAVSLGSMSYSVLFTYLSMLIPTFFGVISYGQSLGFLQWVGLVLMIITFVLSIDKSSGNKSVSLKWFAVVFASFVCWGLIGICQQVHQNSAYASELDGLLLWTFTFSTIKFSLLYFFAQKKYPNITAQYKIKSKATIFVIVAGLFIGAINKINLYLSGVMLSYVFFPVTNGGAIILSGLAAIVIFKEKLSKKQLTGFLLGLMSILLLGM